MLGDVATWRHVAAHVLGPGPMDGCNPEEDEQLLSDAERYTGFHQSWEYRLPSVVGIGHGNCHF